MGLIRRGIFGMLFAFIIFIGISILSSANISLFDPEFLTLGGLILLLSMGIFETNFVFYE